MHRSRLPTTYGFAGRSTGMQVFKEEYDIGRNNEVMFNVKDRAETFYMKTIDFSSDILQYLIKYGKFTVNTKSPSSDKVLSLSINDSTTPLLQSSMLKSKFGDNFIVNITIKNIFDAYRFIFSELGIQELTSFKHEYQNIHAMIKKYYKNLLITNAPTKLFVHDNFEHLVKFPVPCSTIYLKELLPGLDSKYLEDDFILSYSHIESFRILVDCLKKFYMPEFQVTNSSQLPTPYLDKTGKIHRTVIIDDSVVHPQQNKKFIIIGTNYFGMQLTNTLFKNSSGYGDILNDQRDNYESWLKQYTLQELREKITKGELDKESLERLKSVDVDDVQFSDYILNKKKIAGVDFDYIKKMGFLTDDEFNEMLKYLKWKVNKMCINKFNKPNCSIQYLWHIMEVSINPDGNPDFDTLEYAINTVREINENHKGVFEKVQELSWTTMLELNGIISEKSPDDIDYKQVFTDTNLYEGFALESYYIHPLNYKSNYFYKENKVFSLEELIGNCDLECDGEFPGMEQFKGLPFYAVVPIELTSYPYSLNSSFYFKDITCNLVTEQHSRRNNYSTGAAVADKISKKNNAHYAKGVKRTLTLSYRNALLKSPVPMSQPASNVLDKTIIKLANGTEINTTPNNIEKQRYLEKLFNSRTIKVYSTFITSDGLLVVTLLDIKLNKFYYLLLEVNIKQSKQELITDVIGDYKQHKLTRKSRNRTGTRPKIETFYRGISQTNIYGAKDLPLINIYLVMEFTPGNKIFTTLGNECIYKLFSEEHEFFTKPTITLDYNRVKPNVEINNFYGYMLISLINMINTIKSVLEGALTIQLADGEIVKYYRIKEKDSNTDIYKMVSEAELVDVVNPKTDKINYEGIKDNEGKNNKGNPKARSNTLKIETDLFPNNNVFMTVGKHYIVLMNKYYEDELKTQYIPQNKQQLKYHYKFTTWILPREYVIKCLKIIKEHSRDDLIKIDSTPALFRLTSLYDGDLVEIDRHIKSHSEYIKKYIIPKDPYNCKDTQPKIVINPSSDISSSIIHLHFLNEIIHEASIKKINYKNELLALQMSLYDMPTINNFGINKLMNKFKTNKVKTIKKCFTNPFITSIKLSYLLQLPMT